MAIEPFAEKIRADTRAYNEKIAKRNRDNEISDLIKGLGAVGVMKLGSAYGKTILQDNMNDFLSTETSVLKNQREYGNAIDARDKINTAYDAMIDGGLGERYRVDSYRKALEDYYKTRIPAKYIGNAGAWNGLILKQATELSKRDHTNLVAAYTSGENLGTKESYDKKVASELLKVKPLTTTDAIIRGIQNILPGGKNTKQREQELLKYLENNTFINNARAFKKLNNIYNESGDINFSLDNFLDEKVTMANEEGKQVEVSLIDLMSGKVKFDDFGQNIETEDTKIQEVDGTLGLVVQTISSSVNQPEIQKLVGQEFIPLSLGKEGDQKAKDKLNQDNLRAANTAFNFAKNLEILTPSAAALFTKELKKRGLQAAAQETIEDYMTVGKIFNSFLSETNEKGDAINLRDPAKTAIVKELFDSVMGEQGIASSINSVTQAISEGKSKEEIDALQKNVTQQLIEVSEILKVAGEGSDMGTRGQVPKDIPAYTKNPYPPSIIPDDEWSEMTIEVQKQFMEGLKKGLYKDVDSWIEYLKDQKSKNPTS